MYAPASDFNDIRGLDMAGNEIKDLGDAVLASQNQLNELMDTLTVEQQQKRNLIRYIGVLTKLVGANSRATVALLQSTQNLPEEQTQALLDALQEYGTELESVSQDLANPSNS